MIRIGIIGAGGNTRNRHIPELQKIDGVRIDAVCNRSVQSSQAVCDEFGIERALDDPAQVLNDAQLDAVVIGTWPYKHAEFTVAALQAGKHVMCEARMACDVDEAQRMLDASRSNPKLVAQIVPAPMTLAYDEQVSRLVADQLGELVSVRAKAHMAGFPDPNAEATWRRLREYSGNNIMGIGIVYEMIMRWVGPLAWVQASLQHEDGVGDIPDHVNILGGFRHDGAGLLMSATSAAAAFDDGFEVWLHGHDAAVHIDISNKVVRFGKRGDTQMQILDLPDKDGWRVEQDFVDAIRGEKPMTLTDFETGLEYMKFTDALHRSHEQQAAVKL